MASAIFVDLGLGTELVRSRTQLLGLGQVGAVSKKHPLNLLIAQSALRPTGDLVTFKLRAGGTASLGSYGWRKRKEIIEPTAE